MFIVDYKRTPIGKFLGSISDMSAPELTQPLFSYYLANYPFLRKKVDEVILGNVLSAGIGLNPARIASVTGGIDVSVPAYTINHACASGMNAIIQGVRAIETNNAHLVLVGGMESMSNAPHILRGIRSGIKFGSIDLIDVVRNDGLYCCLSKSLAGELSESLSGKYNITRQDQDNYALYSHKKAYEFSQTTFYKREVLPNKKLTVDETIRQDTSSGQLSKLKPVFAKKGTITAGNASPLSDGAALMLIASDRAVKKYKLKPQAKIIDSVYVGLNPTLMGLGPYYAVTKLLNRNKFSMGKIDLFEINEAFAGQVLAVIKKLSIEKEKVNVLGGSIALGHPLGMSGARVVGSLITSLKIKKKKLGIASLCVGGGQGCAMLIENL